MARKKQPEKIIYIYMYSGDNYIEVCRNKKEAMRLKKHYPEDRVFSYTRVKEEK